MNTTGEPPEKPEDTELSVAWKAFVESLVLALRLDRLAAWAVRHSGGSR